MECIIAVIALAVTSEGIAEYIKMFIDTVNARCWRNLITMSSVIAVLVTICILEGIDMYEYLDVGINHSVVGCILTGIFASRGSDYIKAFTSKLINPKI